MTTCPSCNQLRQTFINTPKGLVCSECFSTINPNNSTAMTLRDWFAGMALQGYCANPANNERVVKADAELAYVAANAMLAERSKT